MVTRLRLDAALYTPAPPRRAGQPGRPRKKGERLPTLEAVLSDSHTAWQAVEATWWYGRAAKRLDVTTGTAVWYHSGMPIVPLRWVLVRDPEGDLDPKALPLYGPGRRPDGRAALVRPALERGSHLRGSAGGRGSAGASGCGNATAVVRPRHLAHHAVSAGPLLAGGTDGSASWSTGASCESGRAPGIRKSKPPSPVRSRQCGERCGEGRVFRCPIRPPRPLKSPAPCLSGLQKPLATPYNAKVKLS